MLDTEAFREFKAGLNLLRDNYAGRALPHMQRAMELDRNNPYYMSYLGVVLARSEQKWGEAERLCDAAVRMKRNQAQLYLNLAEVYATGGAQRRCRRCVAGGTEVCASRCAAHDRDESPDASARTGAVVPDPAASGESAARNDSPSRVADVE